MKQLLAKILARSQDAKKWIEMNPLLLLGELGIETDTRYFKFGDGIHQWNELPYANIKIDSIQIEANDLGLVQDKDGKVYPTYKGTKSNQGSFINNKIEGIDFVFDKASNTMNIY